MFGRHVSKRLSAYCNGETSVDESRRIAEHLIGCERCRKEYDEIKLGVQLAGQLSLVTAPDEIWAELQKLIADKTGGGKPQRVRQSVSWYRLAAVGAAVVLLVIGGGIFWQSYRDCSSWEIDAITGAVRVGPTSVGGKGRIGEGDTLETGSDGSARINVGQIGEVDLESNTRVRLLEACITEHRIALDRGTLHAKISAPPRLFFVDTPSAQAIDLGCAYTLEVDDQGRSFLKVTAGWVALVRGDIESIVPIGAMCETRPGIGPGTPYFGDASDEFVASLERFDFEDGGDEALRLVLEESRDRDTYTLWHLLTKVSEERRARVVDRIIALVPLPEGVTREGLIRLDREMVDFELWKDAMDIIWF